MKQDGDGIMWGYDELFRLGVFSTGAQQDVTTGWPLHTCIDRITLPIISQDPASSYLSSAKTWKRLSLSL